MATCATPKSSTPPASTTPKRWPAIPDEHQAIEACRIARQLNPHIYIAVRTNFVSQGMLATQAGANHVVVEEVVTADAMQCAVVQQLLGE